MDMTARVTAEMVAYFAGDARRIHHFLKVYAFARTIGEAEGMDGAAQNTLEIAALTHDIGIRNSEAKYGDASGAHQELEGPPEAEKLLLALGAEEGAVARVAYLVGHHHTYSDIRDLDHQILVEADFLVNAYEDGLSREAIAAVRARLFKTAAGTRLLDAIYAPET